MQATTRVPEQEAIKEDQRLGQMPTQQVLQVCVGGGLGMRHSVQRSSCRISLGRMTQSAAASMPPVGCSEKYTGRRTPSEVPVKIDQWPVYIHVCIHPCVYTSMCVGVPPTGAGAEGAALSCWQQAEQATQFLSSCHPRWISCQQAGSKPGGSQQQGTAASHACSGCSCCTA
jgi:hypothetical protein